MGPRRLRARMAQLLLGQLPAATRRDTMAEIRQDPHARAEYDRLVVGLRVLEGDEDFVQTELDRVGEWLLQDLAAAPARAGGRMVAGFWWRLLGVAAVCAAAVVLWRGLPRLEDDGFAVKNLGGPGSALAIEALCGPADPSAEPQPASQYDCPDDGVLSFTTRLAASRSGGFVTLFGVDARGQTLYYAPTPDGARGSIAGVSKDTRDTGVSVRLAVNHVRGKVTVFGLWAPTPVSAEQVAQMAAKLVGLPVARDADEPWHERVPGVVPASVCPSAGACESAELTFSIRRSGP